VSATIHLSESSGPPGTVVNLSGNAGRACTARQQPSFSFESARGAGGGPATQVEVAASTTGSWSATFVVPSYLGFSGAGGRGAAVAPGRYQLVAPWCGGGGSSRATFTVTATPTSKWGQRYVAIVPTLTGAGYWLLQADGAVHAFEAPWFGPRGAIASPSSPIVGMARTYDEGGYWLVDSAGHVFDFGDARNYGSLRSAPQAPVTGMAAAPDGKGYWLLSSDGHVYGFGDARLDGMPTEQLAPFDAIGARPAGGYLVTAAEDSAVYEFPGGALVGGGPGTETSASFVGAAVTPSGNGTYQAEVNGQVVFTGDASTYFGSPIPGSVPANQQIVGAPITGIAATPNGQGYWMVDADGNVYNFGNAPFVGSALH